jgi:DNA polymerase
VSQDRSAGRDLGARLQWLRELGVEELPIPRAGGRPATAASARDGAASPSLEAKVALQAGLFGGVEGIAPVATAPAAKGRGTGRSSLSGIQAPQAPDPAGALQLIRDDIGDCRRCGLCQKRTNIVFGVGNPDARLMFVGEGPGADEDRQGEPFVGRAGQLLTKIIESMGMERKDVYIANVVKCRPPENRTPLPDEIATCSPFLFQQILSIRPRVIVCLGTPAAQTVLGTRDTITRTRGTFQELEGILVMPTFHPAYLLRNPAAKREVWEDMKKVMSELKKTR